MPLAERISISNFQGLLQPEGFPSLPEGWAYRTETFPSPETDIQLFTSIFENQSTREPPRNGLFIIHGQGEHGGRYLHFPHFLQKTVDVIYAPDLRGHGRSEGLRGDVLEFDEYVRDTLHAFRFCMAKLKERCPEGRIHLLGHSMGGLIALKMLQENHDLPLASVSISAPLLGLKIQVPIWKRAAARLLTQVYGELQMNSELDVSKLSRDQSVQRAYQQDRLVHQKATPRFFTSLQMAMSKVFSNPEEIQVPIQFQIPMNDEIVDPEKTLIFYSGLGEIEKNCIQYEDFRHEAFNEFGKERFFEDLERWISQHTLPLSNS